jgi:hypothetical protein
MADFDDIFLLNMEQKELIKNMVKAIAPDNHWNPLLLSFAESITDRPESKQDCIEVLKIIIDDKTFKLNDAGINIEINITDYYISLMNSPNSLFIGNEDEKNFRYINKKNLS